MMCEDCKEQHAVMLWHEMTNEGSLYAYLCRRCYRRRMDLWGMDCDAMTVEELEQAYVA